MTAKNWPGEVLLAVVLDEATDPVHHWWLQTQTYLDPLYNLQKTAWSTEFHYFEYTRTFVFLSAPQKYTYWCVLKLSREHNPVQGQQFNFRSQGQMCPILCKGVKPQLPNLGPIASQFSRQPRIATDGRWQLATPINLPCQHLQPIRLTHPSRVVLVARSDTLTTGHAPRPRSSWQNAISVPGLWWPSTWRKEASDLTSPLTNEANN